jgi:hypothetical protein
MQRSEMKKIPGKFEMHFAYFFALEKVRRKNLTSLLLQRSRVDTLKLTSCEVESSSSEAPNPTRKRENP